MAASALDTSMSGGFRFQSLSASCFRKLFKILLGSLSLVDSGVCLLMTLPPACRLSCVTYAQAYDHCNQSLHHRCIQIMPVWQASLPLGQFQCFVCSSLSFLC